MQNPTSIYIFGASTLGELAHTYLQARYTIIGFVDNDVKKHGTRFLDKPVFAPEDAINQTHIVIASHFATEISAQLRDYGFYNFSVFKAGVAKCLLDLQLPLLDLGRELSRDPEAMIFEDITFSVGGSGILDYALLKMVARRLSPKAYLEIGTWRGESIASIANIVPQCYSISLPDDAITHMDTAGKGFPTTKFSRYFSKNVKNIKHYLTDSTSFDFEKLEVRPNLVYIDGDHSFEGIATDTKNVFNYIDKDNSIVIWHDFKTKDNRYQQITINAIWSVVDKDISDNIFGVDNSMSGIYIPQALQSRFIFQPHDDTLYSYQVSMRNKPNKVD
ncbi:class I SAM-dependent methyltransferase [Lacimicrobium sp. SS2-24]|uniref:class I SAM-dependent methyltransferase n=1 Tax=Lacimicrobium sp. SS2-24 TaxID=2005569 RepID=UPI000B4B22EA|nr:class I SAM-dependent methyltransferase [Lacimicrobium sp. SS2-24]